VTYISSDAEFTPKNVQTKEERVKLVFGVKVSVKNQNNELKPGMPADVKVLSK
jgi:HlyD family secretion protein